MMKGYIQKKWFSVMLGMAIVLFSTFTLRADSPLTSCFFAPAYKDVAEVAQAMRRLEQAEQGVLLDSITAHFLLREDVDLGTRMAVANAQGFGQLANIGVMLQAVAHKHGSDAEEWLNLAKAGEWMKLSEHCKNAGVQSQDLVVMAYLFAMADYTLPRPALPFLALAAKQMENHEVGHWISLLIASQMVMDTEPCRVYVMFEEAKQRSYDQSLWRPEGKMLILDYIALYELACLPDEYSEAYYRVRPVFDTTQVKQTYSHAKYVDLHFVGQVNDELPIAMHTDNRAEEGGYVVVEIKNGGNTHSIPTNVYCELRISTEQGEERLVRQAQVPGIAPRRTEIVSIFLPGIWWQSGSGTMELTLDQAAQIMESNETNNVARMSQ